LDDRYGVAISEIRESDRASSLARFSKNEEVVMASIQEFRAHVRSVGLPLGCYYFVVLPNLPGVTGQNTVALLCESATLPGVNVASNQLKIFGEASDVAFGIDYAPVQLQFLLDHKMDALKYFTYWNNLAFDRETRTVGYYSASTSSKYSHDGYAKEMIIYITDKNGKLIYGTKLIDAWPKTISDIQLTTSARNVMQVNVTMNYRFWEAIAFDAKGNEISKTPKNIGNAGRGISQILKNDIFKESMGNLNLSAAGAGRGFAQVSGNNGLTSIGSKLATDLQRTGKITGTLMGTPGSEINPAAEPQFGSKFGGLMDTLGTGMGIFGNSVSAIGSAVGTIAGPAFAAGNAIGTVAGTLGSVDSLLKKVGIDSGLGSSARNLAQVSGKLSSAATLGGVPGSLMSVGSTMGAIGSSLEYAKNSIAGLPGATKTIGSAISNMAGAFSSNGSNLADGASTIPGD
jgi:hypothetical protein